MTNGKYRIAGWMALASVCVVIPCGVMNMLIGARPDKFFSLIPVLAYFSLLEWTLSSYAFYRFKDFLNEHYNFHKVDVFIIIFIISSMIMYIIMITTLVLAGDSMPTRGMPIHPAKIAGIIGVAANGLIFGILGIIFGVKLLKLEAGLHGLLKPMAYVAIAGSICILLFLLAPLGSLLFSVFTILMAIVLIKGKDREEIPEFV
ncbi:hypothetical protein KAU08_13330 [bacterium]|nr:hypothetical protein [bacterium]